MILKEGEVGMIKNKGIGPESKGGGVREGLGRRGVGKVAGGRIGKGKGGGERERGGKGGGDNEWPAAASLWLAMHYRQLFAGF